jgi:hypothetical protein
VCLSNHFFGASSTSPREAGSATTQTPRYTATMASGYGLAGGMYALYLQCHFAGRLGVSEGRGGDRTDEEEPATHGRTTTNTRQAERTRRCMRATGSVGSAHDMTRTCVSMRSRRVHGSTRSSAHLHQSYTYAPLRPHSSCPQQTRKRAY